MDSGCKNSSLRYRAYRSRTAWMGVLVTLLAAFLAGGALIVGTQVSLVQPATAAVWSGNYASVFSGFKSQLMGSTNGKLAPQAHVQVDFNFAVPASAAPGEQFKLTVESPFRMNFTGLAVEADGETIATAMGSEQTLTITLTEAVAELQDITGQVTIPVTARRQTSEVTVNLVFTGGGVELGPGDAYTVPQITYAHTNIDAAPVTMGSEIGFVTTARIRATNFDTDSVQATLQIEEEGATPYCAGTYRPRYGWYGDDEEAGGASSLSSGTADVVECDVQSRTVTVRLPADAVEADGTTVLQFSVYWVVDRAASEYTIEGSIWGTANGGRVGIDKTITRTSPTLTGVADGSLRPAQIEVTKTTAETPVEVGSEVIWEVTVTNLEEMRTAYQVEARDYLPANVEFVSATGGGAYDAAAHTVKWGAVDVAAGQTVAYQVTGLVLESETLDAVTNVAEATGQNSCIDGDMTGSVCWAEVTRDVARSAVGLEKRVVEVVDAGTDDVTGNAGDTLVYEFEIANLGNTTLESALLTDELLGIANYECLAEPLEPAGSVLCQGEFTYSITEADEVAGSVTNYATLVSPGADLAAAEVTQDVAASPIPAVEEAGEPEALANTGWEGVAVVALGLFSLVAGIGILAYRWDQ